MIFQVDATHASRNVDPLCQQLHIFNLLLGGWIPGSSRKCVWTNRSCHLTRIGMNWISLGTKEEMVWTNTRGRDLHLGLPEPALPLTFFRVEVMSNRQTSQSVCRKTWGHMGAFRKVTASLSSWNSCGLHSLGHRIDIYIIYIYTYIYIYIIYIYYIILYNII